MTVPQLGERGTTVSADGTPIAWFRSGSGRPIVLVHGAAADHTSWRTTAPYLAPIRTLLALDRRGRGASGDTSPYAIAREYEDVAAVVDELAVASGGRVDVVGHSYGGRVALGAALVTPNVRRLVSYEGAPAPAGGSFHGDRAMDRLEAFAAADDREGLLVCFMSEVVGMTAGELAAFRASPTWPDRVAIARTIVREMWAEAGEDAGPERYSGIRVPVLQVLGGESAALFTDGTWVLDGLLPDSRVVVIPGAKHAAHHTHAERFAGEVLGFIDAGIEDEAVVRRADATDADEIADVLLTSIRATYGFPDVHTDDQVRRWVAETLVAGEETWVAADPDRSIVGFMSLTDDQLDQLYLRPGRTGRGLGTRLLDLAKTRRPDGLALYTFQVNHGARRFYERHGFVAVAFGDGTGNEEGQPDVRYEWRPPSRERRTA